jgi:superfamily II DNA or RNA helicase
MAKIESTLLDNSPDFRMVEKIRWILSEDDVNEFWIATGYWDIPGTSLICSELEKFLQRDGTKIRLLIGKDPMVFRAQLSDVDEKEIICTKDLIKIKLQNLEPKPEYKNSVELLKKYCSGENAKIQIRTFKNPDDENQFFHSKCYIFLENENHGLYAIIGSSNFTQKGLEGNSELNFLECDSYVIDANGKHKGYTEWFDEKWQLTESWNEDFLIALDSFRKKFPRASAEKAEKNSAENLILSPREIYLKFLQDQFDEVINFDGKISPEEYSPKIEGFKTLTYQTEAVNHGMAILKRHHGFILADVVGLGKTYTALMIAKRHLIETGFKNPVLIITPPAVKQSWENSIQDFDKGEKENRLLKNKITLTTIGCFDDETEAAHEILPDDFDEEFKSAPYSLIIVDESHRFRNSETVIYRKLDDLISSINPEPYVILLSATPQNNSPYDLKNQIYLFEREPNNSTLQNLGKFGNKLDSYFSEKQKNYKSYIKRSVVVNGKKILKTDEQIQKDKEALKKDSEDIRKRIVEPLVIRRTRTDIQKFYHDDMTSQGLSFPEIQEPVAIPYEMRGELAQLFEDSINIIAREIREMDSDDAEKKDSDDGKSLGYYRYRAIEFLKTDENRSRYEKRNLRVSGTSQQLAQMMEISLVKRLESSQAAFKESLHNLNRYTKNMIQMWNADRIFICPDIDVNGELSDESIKKRGSFEKCLDALKEKAGAANKKHSGSEEDGANQEYSRSDFSEDYIKKLSDDLNLIDRLCKKWDVQVDDPKIDTFIRKLESIMASAKYTDRENRENQKLIIFTECIATQKMLVKKFGNCAGEFKILSITAKNRDEMKETVAANFDANYKGKKSDEYQILITTDVLAEGVNLHRANSILNYDSPWNATRLMQRLGRINRIGTDAPKIFSYNFYPSTLGDNQINLKKRTFVKLQSFHELFGEDSQIYSTEERVRKSGIKNDSAAEESESPIMPFIRELKEFREKNPAEYEKLLSIKNSVAGSILSEQKISFASLHEYDAKNKLQNSYLYLADSGGKAFKVSQLEFFERLKIAAQNPQEKTERAEADALNKKILISFEASEQNDSLSASSISKIGRKDMNAAISKIQSLYEINDLDGETVSKLDDICDSLTNGNFSLVKKVLAADLKNDGLGNLQIESEIESLYKFTVRKKSDTTKIVKIELLSK